MLRCLHSDDLHSIFWRVELESVYWLDKNVMFAFLYLGIKISFLQMEATSYNKEFRPDICFQG